jgi:hypothetical protein
MSSSGGTQSTTSKSEPWKNAQPYLNDIMSSASGLFRSGAGRESYPFSTTVPFSNQSEQALTNIEELAGQTPGFVSAAGDNLEKTLNGGFLNDNPYLDQAFSQGADQIENRINSAASLRGRVGSGAHQELLTKNLGQLANNIYGGNYQSERDRMQGATMAAPVLDNLRFSNAERLGSVGASREGLAKDQLQDAMGRFDFSQNNPWEMLNRYNSLIQGFGGLGGKTTGTAPKSGGGLGGAVGGGLAGLGAAGSLGVAAGGPAMWGLAGLGALGGLFG